MSRHDLRFLTALILLFLTTNTFAQVSGDYRSNVNTSGNWNDDASWQRYNGSAWVAATSWPGENTGTQTVTVRNGDAINLNTDVPNAIAALVVGEGTSGTLSTNNNTGRALTVTNGFTVAANASVNMRGLELTVNGESNVYGTITDSHDNGYGYFYGELIVHNGGSISTSNASAFNFRGGIDNEGTIDLGGGNAVSFTNANQNIIGSGAITFSGTVTVTGFTVTNQSTNLNLTGTGANSLTGTGGWTQGTNGVLNFSGASMNITTTTFTASGNTVNYTLGGTQTIRSTTYRNLTISTSGTKTLGGAITVNGNLEISTTSTTTLACDIYQITGNASGTFTMASGTTLTLGRTSNAANILFPTNFTNGNISLDSASTVIYQNNNTQTVSSTPTYGNLTIATGNTKTLNGNLSVGGNLTISAGTFDLGTTATTVSITGTATVTGTLAFGGTSTKAVSIGGNLSGAGTINMSGGSLLHTLNLGGATNAITTFTVAAVASTVNYNAAGDQQIFSSANYRSLTVSGSGIKTLAGNVTVNNNLSISGTATLASDIYQITGNASGTFSMGTGTALSLGRTNSATNVSFPTNFTTGNTSLHSESTVIYQSTGAQTISSTPAYGSLTAATSGTKTLGGAITVNGNLAISGSATLACDVYQITGNVSGTFTMASGTTITLGNTGSATNVLFPSNFTNGNISLNSASTVIYQSSSAQTVSGVPAYGNLTIATSGTKTLTAATIVNGNLAISGSATLACDAYQMTGNASGTFTMASGTTLTLGNTGNATNVLFPTNFTAGNITLNSASTVTYQNNSTQTVSLTPTYGHLTIATGGTKSISGNIAIGGNLTVSAGTFDLGTTATTVSVAGNAVIAGTLSFNGTSTKTVTITGDLSGAGTIDMSGGSLLHNLNLGGANNAIGTFTTAAVGSTVTYNRGGAQQVFGSVNYRNLTIATSGTKTLTGAVTVGGNLAVTTTSTTTLASDVYQITGNASGTFTMASGTTLTLGNTGSATNVLFPTNFTSGNIALNSASTVTYQNSSTQTVSITPTYGNLTIATGGTKTLQGNTAIAGNLTISAGTFDLSTTATTVSVAGTATVTGTLSFNGTTTKTVTITGNLSGGGTINMSGGSLLHTLNLGGATNAITTFTTAAVASNVNYTRAGNQTVFGSTNYRNLSTSGSGTKSMSGTVTVNNTFTIGNGTTFDPVGNSITVNGSSIFAGTFAESNTGGTNNFQSVDLSGGTINGSVTDVTNINGNLSVLTGNGTIGRTTLTVSGTTTIAAGRTLNLNNNTGTKTFVGEITVEGDGAWTSTTVSTTGNLVLRGGIDVQSSSGSFSAGGATFNTNDQNITGAGAISFDDAVTITGARIIENTNTQGVTFYNTVNGSAGGSTWRNGVNGITYYRPASSSQQPMNTGTLDVSASGNQFHYSRAGNQNVKAPATSYYHLYLSGGSSGIKTLQGATSVSGDMYIAASTSLEPAAQSLTVSGISTIAGTLVDNNTTGTTSLQDVDLSGGRIDGSATGVVNINGNLTMPSDNGIIGRMTLTVTGTTTIANGTTLTFNASSNTGVKRFDGVITLNGTGAWTSSNISTASNLDLRGGIDVVSASGSFAAGAATLNATQNITGAGPVSFANAVSVAGAITVTNTNTSGVTFNNALDGTVAGSTWVNGANAIVNYQGVATQPMNTGVLDASGSGNTFNYNLSGAQTIKAPSTSYHNLVLNGGAVTKTLGGATTVNGNLTIGTNVILDVDAAQSYALAVKGNFVNSGTFLPQNGTMTFSGTTSQAINPGSSSFYNVVVDNSGTEVTLGSNLTVSNTLTINDGIITTDANRVIINSSSADALVCASESNFINGNLRRYLATNTSTYVFPVGNGTSAANSYRAEIINNNLSGITYLDSRFKPLTGHDDAEMNVADYWEFGSLTYNSINNAGVWEIEPNAQPSSGAYGIRLYIGNMSGLVDNEFGLLKRNVGSTSGADWSTGGGTLNPNDADGRTVASGYMKRIGLTSFSEFGAGQGSGSGAGLPIELLRFSAGVEDDNVVVLEWTTATEINNDFFTVERSQNGVAFEDIAVVEGAGNSVQTLSYQISDRMPFEGISYYRLKQTDYDGAFTYSDIVSVSVYPKEQQPEFIVFPNPVSDGKFFAHMENDIAGETLTQLKVFDINGRLIHSSTFTVGEKQLTVELPEHTVAGVYFVQLHTGAGVSKHCIVVN